MNEQKSDNKSTFGFVLLCILFAITIVTYMLHKAGILGDIIRSFVALFFTR